MVICASILTEINKNKYIHSTRVPPLTPQPLVVKSRKQLNEVYYVILNFTKVKLLLL